MISNNICFISGDTRQYYMASIFFSDNYQINTYDLSLIPPANYSSFNTIPLSSVCHIHTSLSDALNSSNIIILPFRIDNTLANELSTNITLLKDKYLFGGNIPSSFSDLLKTNAITYYNYFEADHIARANAIATAEGTILELIKRSPYNLHGSNILITGYGNCAQVLASKLAGLNAHVTICCRNHFYGTCALSNGLNYIPLTNLDNNINDYQYIINTIPSPIFSNEILSHLNKHTILLDIASSPGGFDIDYATSLSLNAASLPGIPGKISPYSSASILYSYITDVLSNHLYINT